MSIGVLGSDLAGGRWLAADRMAMWDQARVVGIERGTSGTVLRLCLGQVPDIVPGQYYLARLAVDAPPGVVEQAYSLCSSPYPPSAEIEIAVREVPGGRASPVLARQVEVGELLQVRGPFGFLTWTERDGGPIGLIGAGSGVAPLTAIVRYAAARELTMPMTLLSSSRDRRSALLGEPLEALARDRAWFTLASTVTRNPADLTSPYRRRIDADMLAEVFMEAPRERRPHIYYVAGPGDMVIEMRALLGSLGVADSAIYSEDHA
jgi:ferredoxin-NADP reductase